MTFSMFTPQLGVCACLLLLCAILPAPAAEVCLRLVPDRISQATLKTSQDGSYEIETEGGDPYVYTAPFEEGFDPKKAHVVSFEYFCPSGLDLIQVFFGPPVSERRSVKTGALPVSEGWSAFSVDMSGNAEWASGAKLMRLDFGTKPNRTIRVRNLKLRPPTPRERQIAEQRAAKQKEERELDARLRDYLARDFSSQVMHVEVGDESVTVRGQANEEGKARLCEIPMHRQVADPVALREAWKHEIPSGRFELVMDRFVREGRQLRDRLMSKWCIVSGGRGHVELLSHAQYADAVEAKWELTQEKPLSIKGLGALDGSPATTAEYRELGIHNMTLNILLAALLRSKPSGQTIPHELNGKTYHISASRVARLDRCLMAAAKCQIVVSAIILVQKPSHISDPVIRRAMPHPDCDPAGIYAMANVTTAEGIEYYSAALDFLAQRYSRPDKRFGRITHWIIHNEVDAGWVWTNAGDKTVRLYLDLYHRSMRTAYYTARKYNPHAKVFISLTHYWTKTGPRFHKPREMLKLLAQWCQREGDFEWGLAYHPYPQNLRNPKTWLDTQVDFTFDTPKITFKNIEVLDAWVQQPQMLYRGNKIRTVLLSEQGLNSPDYTDDSLRLQAAGLAYAWNKIKALKTVEAFHYHRRVDHEREGGLKLGLWTVKEGSVTKPEHKKPAWSVYSKCGTREEEKTTAFAKEIVGVGDWADVRYTGPIR